MKTCLRQVGSGLSSFLITTAGICAVLGATAYSVHIEHYNSPAQKAARLAVAFDAPNTESLTHLRAIELADKQPDMKAHPGLYAQRVTADTVTVDSEVLFGEDGAFHTTVKVFETAASLTKPLFEAEAAGKYRVKGHNIVFSDMTGVKSLTPLGGRLAVANWNDTSLETAIEDKRFATYTRKADPDFTPKQPSNSVEK